MSDRNTILDSLDAFIRKYYKNLVIKGLLLSIALLLTLFIIAVAGEHFAYFGTAVRTVIFWLLILSTVVVLAVLVVRPLLQMWSLGPRLSREQAARIVGRHFPEVSDKLLNLLQLQGQAGSAESDLLVASIRQKTLELKPVPFASAVDLRRNRRYLRYALPPLLILVVALLVAPRAVTEPTRRIVNYNTHFEPPAPFVFVVQNELLQAAQQEDFTLLVSTEGDALPAEVYITADGRRQRLRQLGRGQFSHTFRNLRRSFDFTLDGGGVTSQPYRLEVFPNPTVVDFQVALTYPTYTGKASEVLSNEGQLSVPEGTTVRWLFQTRDADSLIFFVESKATAYAPDQSGRIAVSRRVISSVSYGFSVVSSRAPASDTLTFALSAIADAAPLIAVAEMVDSTMPERSYFQGRIKDDYGFSRLEFVTDLTNAADTSLHNRQTYPVALGSDAVQEFTYMLNLNEIALQPGDRFSYWFEVWDNDAINGPKRAVSQRFEHAVPTAEELDQILAQNNSQAQHQASESMLELKQLQEEINEMTRALIDKKELTYQDRQQLKQIAEKQEQVRQMLNQMQQQIKENNRLEQKYKEQSDKLLEKQRELDRLFNEVLDEKMKETMREIERMMNEADKKKVQEQLDNLKMTNEDLEKQIDQDLELMRRLEIEKHVEETIQKMDRLADEQRALSEQTEKARKSDKEQLEEQQEQLSQRYDELRRELEKIKQDYRNLDPSSDFKTDKDLEQKISSEQQKASQQLQKNNPKDAAKEQRKAADDMNQLSEQMAQAQMDIEQSDLAEDAEQVRQLLKNLVRLSFSQEDLIGSLSTTYIQDPRYQTIISGQGRIKVDFVMVEDSLRALAKRQLAVASAINRELDKVDQNLSRSLNDLLDMNQTFYGSYHNTNASSSMQYSMTSFNNLALILAESLDKMQNQMRQNNQQRKSGSCKNKGNKQCSSPGKGKPSPKSMKQMQDELNRQMEALKKQLDKQGNKQGGRYKIGEQNAMSEEFARMAAQQEMIRRMMQEYGQELKQQQAGNGKLAREIDEMLKQMEQTETDLVNRTITNQTINRQKQILTRMLQHEKAEMEREKEQRRESREATDMSGQPSQNELDKYKRLQEQHRELFRSVPPALTPYYKAKVADYFYRLQ
ncbi:MAG: DUF4175 family protein [Bacteroidales bacterium]|nr:DUF4175 family protein [Bacteroidales bacterium]